MPVEGERRSLCVCVREKELVIKLETVDIIHYSSDLMLPSVL